MNLKLRYKIYSFTQEIINVRKYVMKIIKIHLLVRKKT